MPQLGHSFCCSSCAPHPPQNLNVAGLLIPQLGQLTACAVSVTVRICGAIWVGGTVAETVGGTVAETVAGIETGIVFSDVYPSDAGSSGTSAPCGASNT